MATNHLIPTTRIGVNSVIVDIIISCLKGCSLNQSSLSIKSQFGYLLSQNVRQYCVHPSNWHISNNAANLWATITKSSNISTCSYKEIVVADNINQPLTVSTYKGASRKSSCNIQIVPDGKYAYNQLFVTEHITPVSDIISALHIVYENNINSPLLKQYITDVLEKIHLARITRVEDRSILRSSGRISPSDIINKSSIDVYNQINTGYYVPASIILI